MVNGHKFKCRTKAPANGPQAPVYGQSQGGDAPRLQFVRLSAFHHSVPLMTYLTSLRYSTCTFMIFRVLGKIYQLRKNAVYYSIPSILKILIVRELDASCQFEEKCSRCLAKCMESRRYPKRDTQHVVGRNYRTLHTLWRL